MNIIRENVDEVNILLKIKIEKSDYGEPVAKSLKEYRKNAAIPGFRPGKVPEGIIRKRFGKSILAEEVNKILSESLSKFIVDEKLPILGEPLPNEENQKPIDFENDEDFEFAFDIGLAPEVNITLDKRSKFDYYTIKVDEEMIDKQVEAICSQHGTNEPAPEVVENAMARGDFAQLGEEGNEVEEGIRPEGVLLAIERIKDSEIKSAFTGKKVGDRVVFDPVKAFENRHEVGHMLNISHEDAEALNSNFSFIIKEINVFKPAEVNEDLFKKVYGEDSEVKTVKDFRGKVKEEIAGSLKQSSEYKFSIDTRDALINKTDMALPEAFLKRWLKAKNEKLTDEQVENEFGSFLNDLRWQIITDTIIKENDLKVSDEEALDYARRVAVSQFYQYGMYNATNEQVDSFAKMMLEKQEERERLYRKLYEDKVMAVVKEKVSLREKEVTNDEFTRMMK